MIDVKKETAEALKEKVPAKTVFELFSLGIITEQTARRFLIVNEYNSANPQQGQKEVLKEHLAEKYCASTDTVKKYLSKK